MPQTTEEKLEKFTDDLSQLLHSARARAESWLGQRREIADRLEGIRDTASSLLAQFGHTTEIAVAAVKRGRRTARAAGASPATVKRGPGRPPKIAVATPPAAATSPKRAFSAETRAKMAAAQRARWAKFRTGKTATK